MQSSPARNATACGEHSPAHQSRRPDVTVDSPFVPEPVGQSGLPEELVELVPVLCWDLVADICDPLLHTRGILISSPKGSPDRPEQTRRAIRLRRAPRCRNRRAGDIRQGRGTRTRPVPSHPPRRATLRARAGVVPGLKELQGGRILPDCGNEALELGRPARGHRGRAAHETEQLGAGKPGPVLDVREKVPSRDHRRARELEVLRHHRRSGGPGTACQMRDHSSSERVSGSTAWSLRCARRSKPACKSRPTREAAPARASSGRPPRLAETVRALLRPGRVRSWCRQSPFTYAISSPSMSIRNNGPCGSLPLAAFGMGICPVTRAGRGKCTGSSAQNPGPGGSRTSFSVAYVPVTGDLPLDRVSDLLPRLRNYVPGRKERQGCKFTRAEATWTPGLGLVRRRL